MLAEYLLRNPPFGQWADVTAVDLGSGTGGCGTRRVRYKGVAGL